MASTSDLISWLLIAALTISLLYFLFHTTTCRRRRRSAVSAAAGDLPLPPGPPPLPLIGNLHNLAGGVLHLTLTRLARTHGAVMTLKLGLTTTIVISSRDAVREAFTNHDRRLAARPVPDALRAAGFSERSMIFLASSDPRWKAMRAIHATGVLSRRGLAAARRVRERKVLDVVACLRRRAGTVVDVERIVYGGMLNLLSSAFFSVDVVDDVASDHPVCGGGGLPELLHEIVEVVTKPNVSDLVPLLRRLDLQGFRRATARRLERVFTILDDVIDRRLGDHNEKQQHGDYLDLLLELVSAGKITRDTVAVMLFEVFVAGGDTMTVSVVWAMSELLRNPAAMAKARAEMEEFVLATGKEAIEEDDVARLPYLHAAWKEAMRLHPVGPLLLPHCAAEDGIEIGGYAVPKGSTVLFNASAIMRDPEIWERPDEFMPERFLQLGIDDHHRRWDLRGKEFEYTPFGTGTRLCPGLPLAERVVPFILATLLRAFEWRLPDGMSAEELDMSERFSTSNMRASPLKAVPVVVNTNLSVS